MAARVRATVRPREPLADEACRMRALRGASVAFAAQETKRIIVERVRREFEVVELRGGGGRGGHGHGSRCACAVRRTPTVKTRSSGGNDGAARSPAASPAHRPDDSVMRPPPSKGFVATVPRRNGDTASVWWNRHM